MAREREMRLSEEERPRDGDSVFMLPPERSLDSDRLGRSLSADVR